MDIDQQLLDDLLHAYVDNQLSPQQCEQVEAYLRTHPKIRQELLDHRLVNQSLHTLFDPVLERPVPAKVSDLLRTKDHSVPAKSADNVSRLSVSTKPATAHWLYQSFAACVLLAMGGLLGWIMRGELTEMTVSASASLESLAVDAHRIYAREKRHAVEVQAPEQNHLMKWLSARLGESVGPADLTAKGYELLGGRLLPANGKPAGLYLYLGANDTKLTYYIAKLSGKSKTASALTCHILKDNATTVCTWTNASLRYFVIADESEDGLLAISQNIREQSKQQ